MILNYLKGMKLSLTPLNIILLAAVGTGLIYTAIYLVRIIIGVSMPAIPDSYIEDQVKRSFEASKFNAKVEDPKIEKNIFHPERKTQKRIALISMIPNAQLVLHGTFITPGLQMAYMEDSGNPKITSAGERRQQVLKKGDMLSGFVLTEIYPDKVLMVRNNEKLFVKLRENRPASDNAEKLPKIPAMPLKIPEIKQPPMPPQQPPAEAQQQEAPPAEENK